MALIVPGLWKGHIMDFFIVQLIKIPWPILQNSVDTTLAFAYKGQSYLQS